jgi:hypothetical protein
MKTVILDINENTLQLTFTHNDYDLLLKRHQQSRVKVKFTLEQATKAPPRGGVEV